MRNSCTLEVDYRTLLSTLHEQINVLWLIEKLADLQDVANARRRMAPDLAEQQLQAFDKLWRILQATEQEHQKRNAPQKADL